MAPDCRRPRIDSGRDTRRGEGFACALFSSDRLARKRAYDIWQRNNLWMMFNALAIFPQHLTWVALYNRERESDGPGGTAHLVRTTQKWGFKPVELDGRKLLEP